MPKDFCRSNPQQRYQTNVQILVEFSLGCSHSADADADADGGGEASVESKGIFGAWIRGDGSRVAQFALADQVPPSPPQPPPSPSPSPTPPTSKCKFFNDIQLNDPGGNHTKAPVEAADQDACCGVCQADPDCYGAELYGTSCYVKTADLPKVKQIPPKGVPLIACVKTKSTAPLEGEDRRAETASSHFSSPKEAAVEAAVPLAQCGRFVAPEPLPWRQCITPEQHVHAGTQCGCEFSLHDHSSYTFKLAATGSSSGNLWNCTIQPSSTVSMNTSSGSVPILLGQIAFNSTCTTGKPTILANRTL